MSLVVASLHGLAELAMPLAAFAFAGVATLGLLLIPMLIIGVTAWWLTLLLHNDVEISLDAGYEELSEASGRLTASDTAIAERAYALYVARGCEPGRDIEDWLQAERELTGLALVTANA